MAPRLAPAPVPATPAQAWGVPPHSLLVDPLLAPHSEAFSGALFQCHLVQGATGHTAVVAAGGRWAGAGGSQCRLGEWTAGLGRRVDLPCPPCTECRGAGARGGREARQAWAPSAAHPPPVATLPRPRRWDQLLKAAWARQSALSGSVAPMPPLHAVGATLNIDRLVHVAQGSARWRHPGSAPPGECGGQSRRSAGETRSIPLHPRAACSHGSAAQGRCRRRPSSRAALRSRWTDSWRCPLVAPTWCLLDTRPAPAPLPRPPLAVAGLPRLSQADALVCSRGGGGLLRERMALARTLWEAGIAAELLPQAAPSLTDQYEYAQSRGIPWLVIIHASTFEGEAGRAWCRAWRRGWPSPLQASRAPAAFPCAAASLAVHHSRSGALLSGRAPCLQRPRRVLRPCRRAALLGPLPTPCDPRPLPAVQPPTRCVSRP